MSTFDMHLKASRFFSKAFKGDGDNYLVNEAALKVMHLDVATAVGKKMGMDGRMGAIAIVISFITVSYQSIRAATTNRVKSLRSE